VTGLTRDLPGDHLYIRATGAAGVRIGDSHYRRSLLVSRDVLIDDWEPQCLAELEASHFEAIFELAPDIVLLGVGARQQFLHPSRLAEFWRRGVGIEVMTSEAACRTFNILATEGRQVVAALLPLDAE